MAPLRDVLVVGAGVIGGSLALALRDADVSVRVSDADPEQLELARNAGLRACATPRESVEEGAPDTVVICTSLPSVAPVYREYRRILTGAETTFFHAGGLQTASHLSMTQSEGTQLVGTHPLAGSHERGFRGARSNLFQGCTVHVEQKASAEQLQRAMGLWTVAGAGRFVVESAESHDSRMPVVSHLPQLASVVLALTIRERGFRAADLGTGGRDATRLAASPASLWTDIIQRSSDDAQSLLARLQWNISRLRDAIAADDWEQFEAIWREANALYDAGRSGADGD